MVTIAYTNAGIEWQDAIYYSRRYWEFESASDHSRTYSLGDTTFTFVGDFRGEKRYPSDDASVFGIFITDEKTGDSFSMSGFDATWLKALRGDIRTYDLPLHYTGSSKSEYVDGSNFSDTISGNSGNDKIFSGSSDDIISGGSGNDLIVGGFGKDILSGGAGTDKFVFDDGDSSKGYFDKITDFKQGVDLISVKNIANFDFIGRQNFSGDGQEIRYEFVFIKDKWFTQILSEGGDDYGYDFALRLDGKVFLHDYDFIL